MQSDFFRSICRMGIFMICAQSIIHFRPKASYEKYLKMLVGVMILIQLFLPLGKLLFGNGVQEFTARVEQFEKSLNMSMQQAGENASESQKKLEQMTLEEVQTRLESREEEQEEGSSSPIAVNPVEPIRIEAGAEEQ